MVLSRSIVLGFCLACVGAGCGAQAQDEWEKFESTEHRYSVQYPASWYLFTTPLVPELDSLDILNFPPEQAARGVILKESGARITVGPAPPEIKTVKQWIKDDNQFVEAIAQRQVRNLPKHPSGCVELWEFTSKDEVGPGTYFVYTGYYCRTARGLYRILLVNRAGDANQNDLQAVALKIALSLRSW